MLNVKKIILALLFCCIGIFASSGICYVAFAVIIFLTLLSVLLRPEFKISFNQIEDLIPLAFMGVWIYGVIVGLVRHNQPKYIFANFAGMIVYAFYYVLIVFRIPKLTVFKIAFYGGVTIATFTTIIFYLNSWGIISLYRGWSSTGQVRVFITILATAYIPWLYTVSLFFMPNSKKEILRSTFSIKNITSLFIFLICSFSILYISASKGFTLGVLFYFIFVPVLFYSPKFLKGKLNVKLPIFLTFILILFVVYSSLGYGDIVTKLFAKVDISNKARYDQLDFIINDFNFFGNGLGATIKGLVRSISTPYGFELTYLNLIHKFGFMSLILFLGWTYLFIKIIGRILVGKELLFNIAAFGALGYMLPSIGNPLLMHPACVMLNCIALYLTRKPIDKSANKSELVPDAN
jgi:hypothetical protein